MENVVLCCEDKDLCKNLTEMALLKFPRRENNSIRETEKQWTKVEKAKKQDDQK